MGPGKNLHECSQQLKRIAWLGRSVAGLGVLLGPLKEKEGPSMGLRDSVKRETTKGLGEPFGC